MIKMLIVLGLAVTPFLVFQGQDTRPVKLAFALGVALILSLWAIFKGLLKPFKNYWVLLLVFYIYASTKFCPEPQITIFGVDTTWFWIWKPLFHILVFLLALVTISSMDFKYKTIKFFLTTMAWCGTVMGVYVILQYFGLDQFFIPRPGEIHPHGDMSGFLGHPCVVAPYLAMLTFIAFYLRKWWMAGIMILAMIVTRSQIGIGGFVVAGLFFLCLKGKKHILVASIIGLILLAVCGVEYKRHGLNGMFTGSGRYEHWVELTKDLNTPVMKDAPNKYPITGFGIGTFKYVSHVKHKNRFHEAHNDFLELLYNCGIAGLILFLISIGYFLREQLSFKDIWQGKITRYRAHLLTVFVCSALCANGMFIWQLGTHIFYLIVILGLLNNQRRMEWESY